MTLLTVVRDVCATVGVTLPTTVFGSINTDRTAQEMLALANEVAQRIAYDTRDWTALQNPMLAAGISAVEIGPYNTSHFTLPADYKRLLLNANVRSSVSPSQILQFVQTYDEWIQRRFSGSGASYGEWMLINNKILVHPKVPDDATISVPYLTKNCVQLASGGLGDIFMDDADRYLLDERLLKLGMIWQWKAQKGAPYAEDMGSFSDALALAMGKDSPAPTLVGRLPMSHGSVQSMSVTAPSSWPLDGWP